MIIKRAFSGHSFLYVILGRKTIGKSVFLGYEVGVQKTTLKHVSLCEIHHFGLRSPSIILATKTDFP